VCGDKNPLLEIITVNLSPIYPGEPATIEFSALPKIDIPENGIQSILEVYALGFKLAHADFDFCEELGELKCPLPAQKEFETSLSYTIPNEAPSGIEISTKIKVMNTITNVELSCVEVKLKIQARLDEQLDATFPVLSSSMVEFINGISTTWTAHMSPRFSHYTILDAKRFVGGTIMKGQSNYFSLPLKKYEAVPYISNEYSAQVSRSMIENEVPEKFDVRENWPACASVIGRVRDQSDCGSCWAFSSTESFNDRHCIASISENSGSDLTIFSPEDTLSCCKGLFCGMSMGCNGGQPSAAWHWFVKRGVVSGLDYSELNKGMSCKPYEFQPCAHHVDPATSNYPECPSSIYPTPSCINDCTDQDYDVVFDDDLRKASKAYSLRNIEAIQKDIMLYGSVSAAFSVYEDFMSYKGGVYQHVTGSYLGGHAVKIIGWGVDEVSGVEYWLVMNSWNESWGEKGLFRILKGKNHCGIESQIVAGVTA